MARERDDALRETLRLIGDLGEALTTQVRRLARLADGETKAPPSDLIDSLVEDAERIRQRCTELRKRIDEPDETWVGKPPSQPAEAESAAGTTTRAETPAAIGDAVHTLAIEMRMDGRTREEVEDYLARSFGRDDAARIAEEVFRPG
jgi:hypothetical protein